MNVLFLDDLDSRFDEFLKHYPQAKRAKTAKEAIRLLETFAFDLVHLDHDLNCHLPKPHDHHNTGFEVVREILRGDLVDPASTKFIVHSLNTNAARYMRDALKLAGYDAERRPFEERKWIPSGPARSDRVLIRFSHGLGDAVQLSVVLKHLAKYRTTWSVDVVSRVGKHTAMRGLCNASYSERDSRPVESSYAAIYDLLWLENYNGYADRPNSKITNCLEEVFRIPYDRELASYQINISDASQDAARNYLASIGCKEREDGRFNAVVIHYQGNTSPEKKNLEHSDISAVCRALIAHGMVPVILDWDGRSSLPDQKKIFCPRVGENDLWGSTGTGDAERIAALVSVAAFFIGIDSGPGKAASATSTPVLICWVRHHPIQFHDPCETTWHLVPHDHCSIPPAQNPAVQKYFYDNYNVKHYHPGAISSAIIKHVFENQGVERKTAKGLVDIDGFWAPAEYPEQAWVIIEDVFWKDSYKIGIRPKPTGEEFVVDIGANIGTFARKYHEHNPDAKIVCVEANPKAIESLSRNASGFAEIVNAACHYGKGKLVLLDTFNEAGESIGGSMIVDEAEAEKAGPQYIASADPVVTTTLEEIMRRHGRNHIDVLKLDCEGSEFSILRGCDLDRIKFIFAESHGAARWAELVREKFSSGQHDIGCMTQSGCGNFQTWHVENFRPVDFQPVERVKILTAADSAMRNVQELTLPSLQAYAAKNNHFLQVRCDFGGTVSQSKIRFMVDALNDCDWLAWIDADAMIANIDCDFRWHTKTEADLVVSVDHQYGLNTGVMLVRNSAWSLAFLQRMAHICRGSVNDRDAMRAELLRTDPARIHQRPFRAFNSIATVGRYHEGDFIVHFAGDTEREARIRDFIRKQINKGLK